MRRTRILLTVILLLALSPCCRRCGARPRVRIGGHVWQVELALDEPTRRKGLAGRDDIPQGTGMLFVFPRQEPLQFHMLGCRVPIDVAFISAELQVVDIHTMLVEPDPQNPQVTYPSRHAARFALEVAGGALRRAGVKVGDRVELLGPAADAAKDAR